ncbi:ACP synthase [Paraburkholderia lacunae]|uniref:ACP synthase n=1 Tax=Paraburkholderia lacunae TaxID=2211104 RepID=UPI001FCB8143|nr:ACP synthase [Paraburkholderia lacunae]
MKPLTKFKRPTTYKEIVQHACDQHARHLADLKRAERHIRAIERDLSLLDESGIGFDVGGYSMRLQDVSRPDSVNRRAKWALHISVGIWSINEDRLIAGFIALGWIVESGEATAHGGSVVLRQAKTQIRVHIYGRPEYLRSILPKEDAPDATFADVGGIPSTQEASHG